MRRNFIGKVLGLGMAVILAFGSVPVSIVKAEESPVTEVYYGDVDDDGKIGAKDVTTLRRHLAGGWNVTINEEKADINGDNKVDAKDVTLLRRYLAGGWGLELPEKRAKYNFNGLIKIGDIVFPCNKAWTDFYSYGSDGAMGAGLTTDNGIVSLYIVSSLTQGECDNWLSSKEKFSEIGQKNAYEDPSNPANYTTVEVEVIEESDVWYGKMTLSYYTNDEHGSYTGYYKIIDNCLIETFTAEYGFDGDPADMDILAWESCKLARRVSESDMPCSFINSTESHVWVEIERVDPTESENGYVKYRCSNCGEEQTATLYKTDPNAGMYYDDCGLEQFVPWSKMVEDGIVTVEDNTVTSFDAKRLKGKLIIQNGITDIVEYIGYENMLTSIFIPESLTSLSKNDLDGTVFRNCNRLTEIVVAPGNPVFDSRDNCNAIVITATNTLCACSNSTTFPSSVETIGRFAFNAYSLESIEIPGTIKKIQSYAFGVSNYNIKTITLSDGLEKIENNAFSGIQNLEELIIPSTVTHIGSSVFESDEKLKKIVVSSDNDTYYSGEDCDYISEKNTKRLVYSLSASIPEGTRIIGDGAIITISSTTDNTLDYLEIPASVVRIEGWAIRYYNIKHICFKGKPPKIGEMNFVVFNNGKLVPNPDLVDIKVPSEYLEGYKELLPQFADKIIADCEHEWGETERVEPTEKNGYIKYICSKCGAIKTEILFAESPEAGMYYQEGSVEQFIPWDELIDEGYITVVDNVITSADAFRINGSLRIQNGIMGIEADFGIRYPLNTSKLKSVYIPESVISIKVDDQWRTPFAYCDNLEEIIVDPANQVYDSRNNCNAIIEKRSITLVVGCKNSTIPDTVFEIGSGAFKGSGIEYVEVPGTVRNIRLGAFSECKSLKKVKISEGVGLIDAVSFSQVDQLEEIEIPSSVYYIGVNNFANNPKLKTIKVAEGNNYYKSIDDKVLVEISSGKLIISLDHTIPDGTRSFAPESMTSGIEITPYTVLDELVFPATVEEIHNHGVYRIDIKHLVFLGAPPIITEDNFMAYDNTYVLTPLPSLIDIKVPAEYLEAYKELLPQFADKIIPNDGE